MNCVAWKRKVFASGFSRYITFFGGRALVADLLAGDFALGEERVILSAFLILLGVDAQQLPVGMIFLSEKYSVSIRSNEFRRRHRALGHVVGGDRDVLNGDAGVGLELSAIALS